MALEDISKVLRPLITYASSKENRVEEGGGWSMAAMKGAESFVSLLERRVRVWMVEWGIASATKQNHALISLKKVHYNGVL